jgi:hypothetical protein
MTATKAQKWTYTVVAKATFGGFEAYLIDHGAHLFVRALKWKGKQPRLVLERMPKYGSDGEWGYHDAGFEDWLPLLSPCHEEHSFDGDGEHAQNLIDQWLSQQRGSPAVGPYGRQANMLPA